jgi:hypothetical protein
LVVRKGRLVAAEVNPRTFDEGLDVAPRAAVHFRDTFGPYSAVACAGESR